MFDIGMVEMFLLVVVAIIVVGPKDLPKLLRSLGQMMSRIRALSSEFQSSIRQMADEVELQEVTERLNKAGNIPLGDASQKPVTENSQTTETKDTMMQGDLDLEDTTENSPPDLQDDTKEKSS